MKSHLGFFLMPFVFLLGIQLISSQIISAAPLIVGSYKVTENTDLGAQVRITLELTLTNPTSAAVTITHVGLRSISVPSQLVSAARTVVVQSHSETQVTLQFLFPKNDYAAWSKGPHQQFLFTLLPSGGKTTRFYSPLLRTQS